MYKYIFKFEIYFSASKWNFRITVVMMKFLFFFFFISLFLLLFLFLFILILSRFISHLDDMFYVFILHHHLLSFIVLLYQIWYISLIGPLPQFFLNQIILWTFFKLFNINYKNIFLCYETNVEDLPTTYKKNVEDLPSTAIMLLS